MVRREDEMQVPDDELHTTWQLKAGADVSSHKVSLSGTEVSAEFQTHDVDEGVVLTQGRDLQNNDGVGTVPFATPATFHTAN